MANVARSGSDGTGLALGFQPNYGTRITTNAGMIPRLFPCSNLTIDEQADTVENNLIAGFGAAQPNEVGKFSVGGNIVTKILFEEILHFLKGLLVPSTPSSTALAVLASSAWNAAGNPNGAVNPGASPQGKPTLNAASGGGRYPSKLELALAGSPTFATDAKMVIGGKRIRGRDANYDLFQDEETVPLTTANAKSETFWYEVDTANITGVTAATSATFTFDPDGYRTVVSFQATNPKFPGYTGLVLKGGSPGVARDLVPVNMLLNATEETIDVTFDWVGSRYDRYQTIAQGLSRAVKLDASDISYFQEPAQEYAQGWAGAFQFGDEIVKYTSVDLGINLNLAAETGVDGSSFRTGTQRTGNRGIQFSPTTYFRAPEELTDPYLNFQEKFRNDDREPLSLLNIRFDGDGRKRVVEWRTPSAKVAESPQIPVSGPSEIEEPLVFQALPSSGVTSEIEIVIISETEIAA